MEKYEITGANKLHGEVSIQGSKNAAVAILLSTMLVQGECIIQNLPSISDAHGCIDILKYYGCDVIYLDVNTVKINTENIENRAMPQNLVSTMRASSYLIGALIGKFGECELPCVGGCDFGSRPIDYHINALKDLGCEIENIGNATRISVRDRLHSAVIDFPSKSVGATINTIIATAKSDAKAVINNAAKEPHVKAVCDFLNKCGADISGGGTDTITVNGVSRLHGCNFSIGADMIEAGTYIIFGLVSGGRIRCTNTPTDELNSFLEALKGAGASIEATPTTVTVKPSIINGTNIETDPFPAIPTDLQPQLSALLGIAKGESIVREKVFKNRFNYLNELSKGGLSYSLNNNEIHIKGIHRYHSADYTATDLRGGAATVIASLNAKGKSSISNISLIERGYESLPKKLSSLGADIKKIPLIPLSNMQRQGLQQDRSF